jgi:endoglucanase
MLKKIFLSCFATMTVVVMIHAQGPAQVSKFIRVDQFGYRPNSSKVAVLADPQAGYDAAESFTPSGQYQLRKWSDNSVVYNAAPVPWSSGATDASSGDKNWWFDFSSVTTPGSYYVFDVGNNAGSHRFEIAENVYNDVLKAAVRMFFYNRCGVAKPAINAGANWADGASFNGPGQDKNCRSVYDRNNAATEKDLSGGWWDAGDFNKYVTFANQPVHQLLDAYEQNPSIWRDDYEIPESGNGFPDLLDELKWELDWLKKMQQNDGSVLIKMGCLVNSDGSATLPPSTDTRPRYYYPGGCSSSSIAAAGMYAHAALVYQTFNTQTAFANDLKQRAINAYGWYQNNPKSNSCDDGTIQAGDADWGLDDQERTAVMAAIYLYALTNDVIYRNYVDANYNKLIAIRDNWWGPYEIAADALLYYTKLSGATASVVTEIKQKKNNTAGYADFYKWRNSEKDPYRAFIPESMYHWGSHNTRANVANINYDMFTYNLDAANHAEYKQRAEEMLHYYHGVNPFNMVYLTNMSGYGAERSVKEVFHSWFKDGSAWDNINSAKGGPAPGYVPGGPNKDYKNGNGACLLSPPCNQPRQKAFLEWNTVWPDASWEVTEPAIYYQTAYIKMLSHFVTTNGPGIVTSVRNLGRNEHLEVELLPNPSKGLAQIRYKAKKLKPISITITDMNGRLVQQFTEKTIGTEGSIAMNLQHQPAGVYQVRLQQDAEALLLTAVLTD